MERSKAKARQATALALLAALFSTGGARARQEQTPTFKERLEITEVLLDVIVTDGLGNPVVGLDKSDFVVEENGREMEVISADFYSARYGARASMAGAVPSRASRYFIFFFDDVHKESDHVNRLVRRQSDAAHHSLEWIENEMQPSDWIAVAGHGPGLRIFHDFTQDREALKQAFSDASQGRDPEKSRWTHDPAAAGAPSLLRELPPAPRSWRKKWNIHTSLSRLAQAAGKIAGRKNLLYFGIGFGVVRPVDGAVTHDRRYYPELMQALNDNKVAVYAIDLMAAGAVNPQSFLLHTTAADTGGVYYRNVVSASRPLRLIGQENVSYYLLSYRSERPQGKRGFQAVRVRLLTPGSGLIVRTRRGYQYGE